MATNNIVNDYLSSTPSTRLGRIDTPSTNENKFDNLYNPKQVATPKQEEVGLARNLGKKFLASTVNLGGATIEAGRQLGAIPEDTATRLQTEGAESANKLIASTSPSYQKEAAKQLIKDGKINTEYSLTTLADRIASSAPDILATIAPAGGLSKLANASKIVKKMGVGGAIGASAAEGLVAGSEAANQHRQEALKTPIEIYRNNPLFNAEVAKLNPLLPLEEREQMAKESLANQSANQVFKDTSLSTGVIGFATGGGALGTLVNRGKITGGLIKAGVKGVVEEGVQEAPQSWNEQLISNTAKKKFIDPTTNVMDGVVNAAAEGMLVGGVMGGAMGGVHGAMDGADSSSKTPIVNPLTGAEFINKKSKDAYTSFVNTFTSNQDTTNPNYQSGYAAATSSLNTIVSDEKAKPSPDATVILEAEQAIQSIDQAHQSLVTREAKAKQEEQDKKDAAQAGQDEAVDEINTPPETQPEEEIKRQEDQTVEELLQSTTIANLSEQSKQRIVDEGMATREDLGMPELQSKESIDTPDEEDTIDRTTLDEIMGDQEAPVVPEAPVEPIVPEAPVEPIVPEAPVPVVEAPIVEEPVILNQEEVEPVATPAPVVEPVINQETAITPADAARIEEQTITPPTPKAPKQNKSGLTAEDQATVDELSSLIETNKAQLKEMGITDQADPRIQSLLRDTMAAQSVIEDILAKPKVKNKKVPRAVKPAPKPTLSPVETSASNTMKANQDTAEALVDLDDLVDAEVDEDVVSAADAIKLIQTKKKAASPIKQLTEEEETEVDNMRVEVDYLAATIDIMKREGASREELADKRAEKSALQAKIREITGEVLRDVVGRKAATWGSDPNDLVAASDFDSASFVGKDRVLLKDHGTAAGIVARIYNMLSDHMKDKVQVHYVENFLEHDWGFQPSGSWLMANGVYIKSANSSDGKAHIYLNGQTLRTREALVGTLAHELIGHFGIAEVLGGSVQYEQYLRQMLHSSPELREDVMSLLPSWQSYLTAWMKVNDINKLPDSQKTTYNIKFPDGVRKITVPHSIEVKMMDEYMAELAKARFLDKEFMQNVAGMGMKPVDTARRSALMAKRYSWLRSFLKRIKHYLTRIFGADTNNITEDDLNNMVAKSIDHLFETLNPDAIFQSDKPFVHPHVQRYEGGDGATTEDGTEAFSQGQLDPADIIPMELASVTDLVGFHNGIASGLGNHADTVRSKLWQKMNDNFASNPVLRSMKALGNMKWQDSFNAIQSIAHGNIAKAEQYTVAMSKVLDTLNPLQNQTVFDYFTTKGYDPTTLAVTPLQRAVIVKAKESIKMLGSQLAAAGVIDPKSYAENEDAYLHTVYLKYLDQYRGSGKKTSMLSWMKKRSKKTEQEQLMLGMIKDVKFLVPETLGTVARDTVLLEMFDNINKMSHQNGLHWVINKNAKITIPGLGKNKVTVDEAYRILDEWKFIVENHLQGNTQTFGTDDPSIVTITNNVGALQAKLDAIQNKALEEAFTAAQAAGDTAATDMQQFLLDKYTRLPNKPQMGTLRNKWVRKEIANDLDALTSAFTFGDKTNPIDKFFSRGGTLERINMLWKLSMVALNPGSWFRNLAGNFALLDLSTSTNKATLMKMLHEEVSGSMNGNQSKYWKLANEYGLFGATWSAVELQDFNNQYSGELKQAKAAFEARTNSSIDDKFHFVDERFLSWGKMMAQTVGAKTSKMYALMEGAFKATAFRDYVNIWEKQQGQSVDNLSEEDKQIIYTKAAKHANDSIFDYSQVNSMVKTLRRIPFGSPFITFSYKAGPAAIKAMINHPIKFAEYATLPALLTMVAMAANDWDDKDLAEIKKGLPEYYRTNPGVAFLPFKDKFGRPQILSLDYVIPWSQYTTAARKVYQNFVEDGGESPMTTGVTSIGTALNTFGFLGGPTPTGIAAMLSGKDSFTGRDIMTPGASASQQLGEVMTFAYNMVTPAWLSSHGWFSKMADAFGINSTGKPTTNRFGDIKYSPAQAVSDITGFRPVGVDVHAGRENNKLGYEMRLREINTLRHKLIKDPNRSSVQKANDLKGITERIKIIRQQMKDNT